MSAKSKKILSAPALKRKIAGLRRKRKKIVFTNGCFDILHYGHISYLQKAKKNNRVLVVGLNSDASVRKIKGRGRPISKQRERAAVLAALECVDFVTIFNQDTPYNLIKKIVPDVLIKGADWKNKGVVGADIVKENGGRVELVRYLPNYSTTKIIKKIKR